MVDKLVDKLVTHVHVDNSEKKHTCHFPFFVYKQSNQMTQNSKKYLHISKPKPNGWPLIRIVSQIRFERIQMSEHTLNLSGKEGISIENLPFKVSWKCVLLTLTTPNLFSSAKFIVCSYFWYSKYLQLGIEWETELKVNKRRELYFDSIFAWIFYRTPKKCVGYYTFT